MSKPRNPNRDKAFEIWSGSGGKISNRELSGMLSESEKVIAAWKSKDGWRDKLNVVLLAKNEKVQHSKPKVQHSKPGKKGAPKGNKNASDNAGGAPMSNRNAVVTGEFADLMLSTFNDAQVALALGAMQSDGLTEVRQQKALVQARLSRQLEQLEKYRTALQGMMLSEISVSDKNGTSKKLTEVDDKIQRCEDGITRTQDLMRKLIAEEHKILVWKQGDKEAQRALIENSPLCGLTEDELRRLTRMKDDQ